MRKLKIAALIVFCIGIPIIAWELYRLLPDGNGLWPAQLRPQPNPAELVTILLTGIAVILAVLTVIVGFLAFLGYREIKEFAQKHANEVLENVVEKRLPSVVQGAIGPLLQGVRRQDAREDAEYEPVNADRSYADAFPQAVVHATTVEATARVVPPVAEEYPKEGGV